MLFNPTKGKTIEITVIITNSLNTGIFSDDIIILCM